MDPYANIAAYRFARMGELKPLRERLLNLCRSWELKGTILLSTEGINLFVAGHPGPVDQLLIELRKLPGLENLEVKRSESDHQPFSRMLVRIKKEIIAFGVEGIDPVDRPSPKLSAKTLKAWLDEGRKLTLIDTRNDYEVKLGTFRNALPAGIDQFRDFPAAVAKLPEALKNEPIVMFCTGGIRCEKAGPFMEQMGFKNVFQLEGGILKYFEDCGGDHYDGECFVFDRRVGLDPGLRETQSVQCFRCQEPLSESDQKDPRYVPGESCPACHRSEEEHATLRREERQARLDQLRNPLPGSLPYDNFRPMSVPGRCQGWALLDFLADILPHIPAEEWLGLAAEGFLMGPDKTPVGPERKVAAGERYYRKLPGCVEPDVNSAIQILHEDEALIVINKPAPLPMHPGGRFNKNTLEFFMHAAYRPEKPRPAHRLDANTTGVLVLSRRQRVAAKVQPQFANGEIDKVYLARVQGHPSSDQFTCSLPITAEPGELGARAIDTQNGLPASTEFQVRQRLPDGTALLEVRPRTGRTHQIRLHLQALGWSICGDPTFLNAGQFGRQQTLETEAPPMCLHAWRIALTHPITKQRTEYEAPTPSWAQGLLRVESEAESRIESARQPGTTDGYLSPT